MPTNIFLTCGGDLPRDGEYNSVAYLCEDIWELPSQLHELELWLKQNGTTLPLGNYVADIGFTQRPDGSGGGGTLSVSTMQTLVALGMEVWFSEYSD